MRDCSAWLHPRTAVVVEVSGASTVCGGRFFSTLTWTPSGDEGRTGFLDDLLPRFLKPAKGICR